MWITDERSPSASTAVRRTSYQVGPQALYDPAQIPSLEEVLALARDTGTGIMFDVKESVRNLAGLANLAADYGVLERSVFIPYVPPRGEVILAAQPTARLNFSNQFGELPDGAPPGVLYAWRASTGRSGPRCPLSMRATSRRSTTVVDS